MFRALLAYRLRRSVLAIGACLALFAGVFAARVFPVMPDVSNLWALGVLAAVSIRRQHFPALLFLLLLTFCLGLHRGTVFMQKLDNHESLHYQKVVLVGRATEDAVYGKRSQLEFTLNDLHTVAPATGDLVGGLTIRGFGEAAIYRGDVVQVTGKLYPARGNNLGTVSFASLRVIERGTSPIDDLRRKFAAGVQTALPEPAASFALGLLIGQRTTLPERTATELRHAGLTHIIAVSGYNLTVIVLMCRRLLAGRSKYQATMACLALVALFLAITGSSPPIVRASIVSLLGLTAWYYGREVKPHVLLLVSAAATVIANPLYLWGNVSWYLSFLAFYGVLVLAPLISKRLFGSKEPSLLATLLVESLCANLLVLPYILHIFGEASRVSLLANMLVVPLIPLAMMLALIAGIAGLVAPFVAGWLAWPAALVLTYMLDVASLVSRLPYAYAEHLILSFTGMIAAYGIIGAVVFVLWLKTRRALPQ